MSVVIKASEPSPCPSLQGWRVLMASLLTLSFLLAAVSFGEDAKPRSDRGRIVLTDAARKLHASSLVIDGHNDMPWEIRKQGDSSFDKMDISKPQPTLQTDIPRLREGGLGAQFWSVWVPMDTYYRGEAFATTLEQIDLVKRMMVRYPETFELALTADDIERIHKEGKIASLIGVEGGHCIEDSLNRLEKLYKLGARYMTLTHTDSLSWADSATDAPRNNGLAPFGREVVRKMNELGMMVDLAHVSAKTMRDTLDVSEAPVIFSHSSARAVADSTRNVPDDVLKRLREKDGIVMVNFFSGFVVPAAAKNFQESVDYERELNKKYDNDQKRVKEEMARLEEDASLSARHYPGSAGSYRSHREGGGSRASRFGLRLRRREQTARATRGCELLSVYHAGVDEPRIHGCTDSRDFGRQPAASVSRSGGLRGEAEDGRSTR